MPAVVVCPACLKKARVPEPMLGKTVRCPACAATFLALADGPVAEPPAPPPGDVLAESEPSDEPAAPQRPPLPGDPDALRSLRAGVFLQLIAQGLYAGSLAIFLLVALGALLTAPAAAPAGMGFGGPMGTSINSTGVLPTLALLVGGLLAIVGVLVGLVGSALCTLAPAAHLARGLAVAALAVSVIGFVSGVDAFRWLGIWMEAMSSRGFGGPGGTMIMAGMLLPLLLLWVFEAGRLTVLALFWRALCFLLRDGTGAALALRLAYAVPSLQAVVFLLGFLFGALGGSSGAARPVVTVIALVAQLGMLVWGVIVAERVWRRLRAAVPPARAA
jgi:hypothetical protein